MMSQSLRMIDKLNKDLQYWSKRMIPDKKETNEWTPRYNKFGIPGTNWCGPGTDINKTGAPKSILDQICKLHDLQYADVEYPNSLADNNMLENIRHISGINARLAETVIGMKLSIDKLAQPLTGHDTNELIAGDPSLQVSHV